MNSTVNSVCLFVAGALVGAFATYGAMKKMGYHKDGEQPLTASLDELTDDSDSKDEEDSSIATIRDKPQFTFDKTINTHRTRYDSLTSKPDPEEMIRAYAEAEHPMEEDEDDDESDFPTGDLVDEKGERIHYPKDDANPNYSAMEIEEDDEETQWQTELAESLMGVEEEEGYGHVLVQLDTGRKADLVFLIPEAYLGEIYSVEALTYYEYDNVLCDANDIPIDNPMQIIGTGLEHFGECLGEVDDAVYIRNCSISVEYEITRVRGYYGAHIYGVTDEEFEGGGMAGLPRKATKRKNTQREED